MIKEPLPVSAEGGFVMRINFIYQGQYAGSVMAGLAAPLANNLITTRPLVLLPELGAACCKDGRSSGWEAMPDRVPVITFREVGLCWAEFLSQRSPRGAQTLR